MLLAHGVVAMRLAPYRDGLEGSFQALLHRLHMHREFPSAASRADMREAEEIESCGLSPHPFGLLEGLTPSECRN